MKKYLMLAAVSALVFSATNSFAATAKTQKAQVTATVVGVGEVKVDENMSFGTLVSPSSQTTVTLGTDGKVGNNIVKVTTDSTAAKFTVTGDTDTPYTLSIEPISLTSGSNSMLLDNFKIKVDNGEYLDSGSKITDGSDTILVGADLTMGAGQASGSYAGEITLTVTY